MPKTVKLKKIWVHSLFATIKAVVPDEAHPEEVQLVGYPYGNSPIVTIMTVPLNRQSLRDVENG